MMKNKIYLGDDERTFILSERKRTGLPAEVVSEKIGRSKSWLAQIENGRMQTIKREDFISLISFLREDKDLKKIEAFIQASMICITRNITPPSSPDDDKVSAFIDNNDYSPKGLDKSFQDWSTAITVLFKNIWEQYPEKQQLETILYNILYNLQTNPGFALSVMSSPLNRLNNSGRQKQNDFITELYSLIKKYGTDDDYDLFLLNQLK